MSKDKIIKSISSIIWCNLYISFKVSWSSSVCGSRDEYMTRVDEIYVNRFFVNGGANVHTVLPRLGGDWIRATVAADAEKEQQAAWRRQYKERQKREKATRKQTTNPTEAPPT